MDNAKKQIVDIINNNSNILVTVSTDPSVDELSAALALTILLNDMDKRATAVFSGAIPPAITFLEPDKTFENTADSLRDFIIALDKEKADHLRYKVDGDVVKIFITPYKTTLTQADLDFSQGDYNVEVVLALGVKDQDHLDKALEAHGKILHDATVLTVTAGADTSSLGSLDWHDNDASSLSEMIVGLIDGLKQDKPLLTEQIATALLTGIVSATDRFSNDRTSSRVMTTSAQLMAAGANQQLIAAKLEEAHDIAPGPITGPKDEAEAVEQAVKSQGDGSELSISRSDREPKVIEPLGQKESESQPAEASLTEAASSEQSAEETAQEQLEKELAGLTAVPAETMADIEQDLKQTASEPTPAPELEPAPAARELEQPAAPEAEPAVSEAAAPPMPTVDEQAPLDMPVPPLPELPPLEEAPQTEAPAPQIVNDHGTRSTAPSENIPPINSIQTTQNEGEATVNLFDAPPTTSVKVEPVSGGTAEGAAFLASEPVASPVSDSAIAPAPAPAQSTAPVIPQLPPLPPLPSDGSLPPLPPPPPPPVPGAMPSAPSGAVTGDVFGDGGAAAPAPTPTEPGQFKIPGQ